MSFMQITIDSDEPLTKVLPVISALYGVDLSVPAQHADVVSARRTRSPRAKQSAGRRSKRAEVKASAIREWARSNGHQVSDRGRVAAELVEAYRAAN
jgi:Lsr2